MLPVATANRTKDFMICHRCGGRMIRQRFYDINSIFHGWHCLICGEILDPVILLHRLSQDANLKIPEGEENIMHLLKKYLQAQPKKTDGGKV